MNVNNFPTFNTLNGNDRVNYNFLTTNIGPFKVDTLTGANGVVSHHFTAMSWDEKLRYHIDFITDYRSRTDLAVSALLTTLLPKLDGQGFTSANELKNLVKHLGKLSPEAFDRTKLKTAPFYKELKKSIQIKGAKKYNGPSKSNARFWSKVREGQIAEWAGIHFKANDGGTSGNYRIRDLSGKIVALVKPVSESPHGEENPHFSIRVRNVFQKILGLHSDTAFVENEGHLREVFASRVSQILGWKVNGKSFVPKTRVGFLESDSFYNKGAKRLECSIHEWRANCEDGHSRILEKTILENKTPFLIATTIAVAFVAIAAIAAVFIYLPAAAVLCTVLVTQVMNAALPIFASMAALAITASVGLGVALMREYIQQRNSQIPAPDSFKMAALIDKAVLNGDGNPGNWLFSNDKLHVFIYYIDAWFSMPKKVPTAPLDRRNMHLWKKLTVAHAPVFKEDVAKIEAKLTKIIALAYKFFPNDETAALMELRLKVILAMAKLNEAERNTLNPKLYTYVDLAEAYTVDQMVGVCQQAGIATPFDPTKTNSVDGESSDEESLSGITETDTLL